MNDVAWYVFGSVAAMLTSFGFVPQVIKMWRTKSVKDISPLSFVQLATGMFLWMLYGAHLQDPVIIIANAVTFVTLVIGLVLYFKSGRGSNREE